jgi:hypothetical protein
MNDRNHSSVSATAEQSAGQQIKTGKGMFDPALIKPAIIDSFKKLSPRTQWRNPVMFVVYVGSILTTACGCRPCWQGRGCARLHPGHYPVAVVYRAVCQLCRSTGRGPQQGTGRQPALGQEKRGGQEAVRPRATPVSPLWMATA